ncbi:MAG: hypothetical protein ACP5HQ_04435 [Thermoprotei archaeon]
MSQIVKFFVHGIYLFALVENKLAYVDLDLDTNTNESGWKDVEITFPHGKVVRLLYCKSRLFNKVCGAIAELNSPIEGKNLEEIYDEIVQAVRNTIG